MSNDAHHCSAPEPGGRGLAEAMRRAPADAGLSPEQISYINAHGTGTEANDKAECKALRKVFGDRAANIPLSSTKSMVGHCLGAAGAVEAVASIVCAEAGVLPPTANFAEPRDGCAVDCVPQAGRKWKAPRCFSSNNSAFGGHNASLALAVPSVRFRIPNLKSQIPAEPLVPAVTDENTEPIFITACGVVSAAGIGMEALVNARREPADRLWGRFQLPGLPSLSAGMVDEAAVEAFDRRLNLRLDGPFEQMGDGGGAAGDSRGEISRKTGGARGTGIVSEPRPPGRRGRSRNFSRRFSSNNHQVTQLSAFPYIVPSSVAGNVCRALMLSGHNLTLSPGPAEACPAWNQPSPRCAAAMPGAILCGAVDEFSERILADSFSAGLISGEDASARRRRGDVHAGNRARTPRRAGRDRWRKFAACAGVTKRFPQPAGRRCHCRVETGRNGRDDDRRCMFQRAADDLNQLHSAWPNSVVRTAAVTGCLEGSQPLLDLAVALRAPELKAGGFVTVAGGSVTNSLACAAVDSEFDSPANRKNSAG